MTSLIPFPAITSAKEVGVRIAASFIAARVGASDIETAAIRKFAVDRLQRGASPARAIADTRAEAMRSVGKTAA